MQPFKLSYTPKKRSAHSANAEMEDDEDCTQVSVNSIPSSKVKLAAQTKKNVRSLSNFNGKKLPLKLLLQGKIDIEREKEPVITPQGFITTLRVKTTPPKVAVNNYGSQDPTSRISNQVPKIKISQLLQDIEDDPLEIKLPSLRAYQPIH